MKILKLILAGLLVSQVTLACDNNKNATEDNTDENEVYQNPVVPKSLPDPTIIKASDDSMMDNHHEVLIHGNERFVGTGHNSEIVQDDAGNDWIFYHSVDKNNPKGRVLMLDEVQWQNGWPSVAGNSPSSVKSVPVFN